jgi:hypothetical protein
MRPAKKKPGRDGSTAGPKGVVSRGEATDAPILGEALTAGQDRAYRREVLLRARKMCQRTGAQLTESASGGVVLAAGGIVRFFDDVQALDQFLRTLQGGAE